MTSQKFIYKDEWGPFGINVDYPELESSYLGNLEMLDTDRYKWDEIKLPKGKSWSKDALTFRNKYYAFSEINFFDSLPDLLIRFRSPKNKAFFFNVSKVPLENGSRLLMCFYKQRPVYLTIKNYCELTALQILHDLYSGSETTYPLGAHFENGLFSFYQAQGLDLGYMYSRRRHDAQI